MKANVKKTFLGISLVALMLSSLAGCVVYDPDPYPRYYYRERYYSYPSRSYYYRPYYYRGYSNRNWHDSD
jgi:hypothetical protein